MKTMMSIIVIGDMYVCLFVAELKRTKTEGTKCQGKTMTSIKEDKTMKEKQSMCRSDRRDEDEGGKEARAKVLFYIKKGESRGSHRKLLLFIMNR